MKKTLLASALVLTMVACMAFGLVACNKTTVKITEGIYDGTYSAGGFTQETYLRFFEDGELLEKQVFYYHAYSVDPTSGVAQPMVKQLLGTYKVLDESITIKCYADGSHRDGEVDEFTEKTADKTVVLYSLDGKTEYCRTGWDTKENKLLGIPAEDNKNGVTVGNKMGVTTYYGNYCYLHSTESKTDKGVALNSFYCDMNEVKNASIVIYHNGTYDDDRVTGASKVSGTYTVSGDTYTLTAGTGAKSGTLVVKTDGAEFTPNGSEKITMTNSRVREATLTLTGTGNSQSNGAQATITVTLYDDYSVTVEGTKPALEGSWSIKKVGDKDATCISVGTDVYIETGTDKDGEYQFVEIDGVTCRTESRPVVTVLHTYVNEAFMFAGNTGTVTLYSNGTAKLECTSHALDESLGLPCSGTYEGRSVTIKTKVGDQVFTISGEEGNFVASNAALGDFVGKTAPAASSNPNPDPDTPKPVNTLFTLTGKVTGPSQTGGTTEYNAELNLNDDFSFVLNLTNNGATVPAAKGTFAVNQKTGGYTLTVKESTFYTVDSTLNVTADWDMSNPQAPVAKSLSVDLPEVKQTHPSVGEITVLNAATLSYSSVKSLYTLTGKASGYDTSGGAMDYNYSLNLTDDFKFELTMTTTASVVVASGEWKVLTTGENAGKYELTVKATFNNMFAVDSSWLATVSYNSDYTLVTGLTLEIPAVSAMHLSSATLTYTAK